jgi:hypothetical protein
MCTISESQEQGFFKLARWFPTLALYCRRIFKLKNFKLKNKLLWTVIYIYVYIIYVLY